MGRERRVIEVGVGDVDLVEGLWKAMVAHHQEVVGGRWPGRDLDLAWQMRRAQYVEWLEADEGFLFLVPDEEEGRGPLGYAFLRLGAASPTFDLGDPCGDLESLSVAPAARGTGIGTQLIGHCRRRLRELGARWWNVTAIAANERAVELYEREGFRVKAHTMLAPTELTDAT